MAKMHCNQTLGFADRLRKVMDEHNVSAIKLGKMIGVRRTTVYEWLWGNVMPNSLYLARICANLKVSADYLLFGEDNTYET